MITTIDTVTQVSIKFLKRKKVNKNMGINIEHNTNNTSRSVQFRSFPFIFKVTGFYRPALP